MGRKPRTSVAQRSAIITLSQEGKTERYIASKLNISKTAVHNTISRKRKTGSLLDQARSGRPKVTSKVEDRRIVTMSKRNRRLTATEICAEINSSREKPVCVSTIKHRLLQHNLRGCVAVKKPLLRKQNKTKRLQWAISHKDWTFADWSKVLWTDESKFEIFGSKRRTFVRRTPQEKMLEQCVVPTVKHGGGSVMVWGSFSANGVGDIVKIDGILRKEQYKNILIRHAVPSGTRLIGNPFVLQEDNDPKHSAKICRSYTANKERQGVLKNMIWPPQSPDLNPIELLWDELDRRVRRQCPTSVTALWEILQYEWKSISQETLHKLIARMPRICSEVKKRRGGFFDEKNV